MLSHPVTIPVLAGLAMLLVFAIRSMWRNRRVNFVHRVAIEELSAERDVLDRVVPVLIREEYRMIASAGHTTVFDRR